MDQIREPCQLLSWSSKSRVAALPQTSATARCLDVTLPCWVPCKQGMPRRKHLPQLSIHNSAKYQHDSVQNDSNCTRIPQTPCQVCRVWFAPISFYNLPRCREGTQKCKEWMHHHMWHIHGLSWSLQIYCMMARSTWTSIEKHSSNAAFCILKDRRKHSICKL